MARLDAIDKKTVQKIEKLAESVVRSVKGGKNPFVEIPIRSLANVKFNEKQRLIELGTQRQKRYFFNVSMAKKFMQTFLVSEACKELIDSGKTTSIRDLYYMTKHTIGETKQNTFEEQDESDPIIEDLEVALDSLREELHLFATRPQGSMVGPDDDPRRRRHHRPAPDGLGRLGRAVDRRGERHPVRQDTRRSTSSSIEKDAVWKRFNEDKFWQREKCIILTGQGQPPRGVRRLVQRLHSRAEAARLRPRRQRSLGLLHLLGAEAGLDQPRLRVDADGGAGRRASSASPRSTR